MASTYLTRTFGSNGNRKTFTISVWIKNTAIGVARSIFHGDTGSNTNGTHDDFYFTPEWDKFIFDEIKKIGHNKFYLSSSTIGTYGTSLDCGDSFDTFNEEKFLSNYNNIKFDDIQGSTWAPHVVHKSLWLKVGGFSNIRSTL